ncbi:MAG: glycosyltransferase [Massilia sp.]
MRILHLLDHSVPRRSPYSLRTMSILQQQRELGWQTIQLTGPRQGQVEVDRNRSGWHFYRTEAPEASLLGGQLLARMASLNCLTRRLRAVAKLTRPDILHAHASAQNGLAALRVGRDLGLPVVYEASPGWSDPAGGLARAIARTAETYVAQRADAVTTSSEAMRVDMRERGVRRAIVVPDAVNLHKFDPVPARDAGLARRLGLGDGPVIGFVGPFYAHEGLALLVGAMPALLAGLPSLRLLLVGAGPEEASLRQQVLQLGLAGKVVFSGLVARRHNGLYHSLIDLLVYPRLPLPLAEVVPAIKPLEAMAHGHLVAASNVGSHRELIQHGRTGFLFQAGSAGALAEAVLRLLADRACWQGLRAGARWFVEYERTWNSSVARYAPLYEKLLERRRRR